MQVLVKGDSVRAVFGLLLPVFVIAVIGYALRSKGYGMSDVPHLFRSGQLTFGRQMLGLLALIYWVVRVTKPALITINSGDTLAWVEDQHLVTSSGVRVPVAQVRSVRRLYNLFNNVIVFETESQGDVRVPALFAQRDVERMANDLRVTAR